MYSIIFLPILLIVSSSYNYYSSQLKTEKIIFLDFIVLIILAFFSAIRYDYGTDWSTYLHMYLYQKRDLLRCEPLFVLINKFLRNNNIPYQYFFGLIAFMQYFFFYKVLKNCHVNTFWGFFFLFINYFFGINNILRQYLAVSIGMYAITYLQKNKFKEYVFFALLAFSFHYSSIILLIPLFLTKVLHQRSFIFKKYIYYLILLVIAIFYKQFFSIFLTLVLTPLSLVFGNNVSIISLFMTHEVPLGSGLGVILQIICYLCLLPNGFYYSNINNSFGFYFKIMYWGIVLFYFSSTNMNLSRVFFFFKCFDIYIYSYMLSRIRKNSIFELRNVFLLLSVFLTILLFLLNSYKGIQDTLIYNIKF